MRSKSDTKNFSDVTLFQNITFKEKEVAESFVSCLVGHYMLLSDFYTSLCQDMEPPSLVNLKKIKSFGPIQYVSI